MLRVSRRSGFAPRVARLGDRRRGVATLIAAIGLGAVLVSWTAEPRAR